MNNSFIPLLVFYVFAAVAVVSALLVITQNNPVRCVLFLVLTFFASAVLWILQDAEFLAMILILVYVGAVMTLFLFVVMMLNIDTEQMKGHLIRHLPFGLIIVALLVGLLMIALPHDLFHTASESKLAANVVSELDQASSETTDGQSAMPLSNTEQIGMVLYTDYIFAFELASMLLLVAIIAAVTLSHRHLLRSKRQNITQQIMTQKSDRVELVSVKSESSKRSHKRH